MEKYSQFRDRGMIAVRIQTMVLLVADPALLCRHGHRALPPCHDAPLHRVNLHPRAPLRLPPALLHHLRLELLLLLPLAPAACRRPKDCSLGPDGHTWHMVG